LPLSVTIQTIENLMTVVISQLFLWTETRENEKLRNKKAGWGAVNPVLADLVGKAVSPVKAYWLWSW
jgi:hypothetical protein